MPNEHNPETGPIEDESSVETIALDMREPLAQAIRHMDAVIRMCQGSGELLFNLEHVQHLMEEHYIQYLPTPECDHEGERQAEAEAERQADAQAEMNAEACYGDDFDGGWY